MTNLPALYRIADKLEKQRIAIALDDAIRVNAASERDRIHAEIVELWQERDEVTDAAIDRGNWLPSEIEYCEELARCTELLTDHCAALYDTEHAPVAAHAPENWDDPGALPFDHQSDVTPRPIEDTHDCARF